MQVIRSSQRRQRLRAFLGSRDAWAIFALCAWPLIRYLPVTLGRQVFSEGDIIWGNMPIRSELTRALAQGRLPLWTPLLQAGMPLFAEGHTAALYPPNLLLHSIIPPYSAISYIILFNLSWVGIGTYLFVRASGLRASSALMAGLVYSASGAVIARVSHLDVLTPISWLPWLMFFLARYWRARAEGGRKVHWFVLGCLAIGIQFLAGSPALIALNLLAFVSICTLGDLLWGGPLGFHLNTLSRTLWARRLEALPVAIMWLALGIGIGAAQLLPTLELIGWSIRGSDLGKAFFTSYSLDPSLLSQFVTPFAEMGIPGAANMEFWAYIGVLPLAFALVAPFLRREFRTIFFALFAAVALSLALGGSNPAYEWLYYVPLFNRFRVPARFLFLFLFGATFLTATGFDELQNRLRDARKTATSSSFMFGAILLVAAGSFYLSYYYPIEAWLEAWRWLPLIFVTLSVTIVLGAASRRMNRQLFQALALGVTCLDLAVFGAPFLSTLDRTVAPSELAQIPRTVLAMDNREPIGRSMVIKFPSVSAASIRATLWSGMPMTYGRAGIITGYMPFSLALQRNEQYIKVMSRTMRNLIGIQYYLLPLEIAPPETQPALDASQPEDGLTMELLGRAPSIPPTPAQYLRVVSYTDQSRELPDGFLAGQVELVLTDGRHLSLPIRMGIETADWAYEGIRQSEAIMHSMPRATSDFPAYLRSVGHDFAGAKYVARLDIPQQDAAAVIAEIGVRSFLPGTGLTVEHIDLVDGDHSVSLSTLLHRNDLTLAFRSDTAAMWDNLDVLPRAFVVNSAQAVSDDQALAIMTSSEFDPFQVVLMEKVPPANLVSDTADSRGIAQIEDYTSDRVTIRVTSESQGYLVLTDAWYPGWVATIDGINVPILRADYMFRAVAISPGEHQVKFEYQPASFLWGAAISVASLLVIVVVTAVAWQAK